MPSHATDRHEPTKTDLIREVLAADPGASTPKVRAALFRRFGAEVTTAEVAQVRRKLRQAAGRGAVARTAAQRTKPEGGRRRKSTGGANGAAADVPPRE